MKCRNFIKIIPMLVLCLASGSVLAELTKSSSLDVYGSKAVVTSMSEAENMAYVHLVDLSTGAIKQVASFPSPSEYFSTYYDYYDPSCSGTGPSTDPFVRIKAPALGETSTSESLIHILKETYNQKCTVIKNTYYDNPFLPFDCDPKDPYDSDGSGDGCYRDISRWSIEYTETTIHLYKESLTTGTVPWEEVELPCTSLPEVEVNKSPIEKTKNSFLASTEYCKHVGYAQSITFNGDQKFCTDGSRPGLYCLDTTTQEIEELSFLSGSFGRFRQPVSISTWLDNTIVMENYNLDKVDELNLYTDVFGNPNKIELVAPPNAGNTEFHSVNIESQYACYSINDSEEIAIYDTTTGATSYISSLLGYAIDVTCLSETNSFGKTCPLVIYNNGYDIYSHSKCTTKKSSSSVNTLLYNTTNRLEEVDSGPSYTAIIERIWNSSKYEYEFKIINHSTKAVTTVSF